MIAALPWLFGSLWTAFVGLLGFGLGGGVSGVSSLIKWGVIGTIAYFTLKELKVI